MPEAVMEAVNARSVSDGECCARSVRLISPTSSWGDLVYWGGDLRTIAPETPNPKATRLRNAVVLIHPTFATFQDSII